MKQQVETFLQDPSPLNPYLNARREWNERYGGYIAQARTWRLVAIISLFIALLAVIGIVYLGSQNRLVPYVVAVDKLGSAVAVQRADIAATPDERVIRSQLARWISNVRSVYSDASAEQAVLKEAYAMVNRRGPAFNVLNDYFRQNDPFDQAKTETISITVQSVLPISGNTWRVEWQENHHSRNGNLTHSQQMQASVSILLDPPQNEETLLLNPMGIYVHSFSWTQRL